MSASIPGNEQGGSESMNRLARVCAPLGMRIWMVEENGSASPCVVGDGPLDRLCSGVEMRGTVAAAVAAARAGEGEWVREAMPGVWTIAAAATGGKCAVSVLLTEDALGCASVREMAAGHEISEQRLRAALNGQPRLGRQGVLSLGEVVRRAWEYEELHERTTRETEQFTSHLSELYEEIGLLYRLCRGMTQVRAPEDFVRRTCEELSRVLPFGWVAVKMLREAPVVAGLKDALEVHGRTGTGNGVSREALSVAGEDTAKRVTPGRTLVMHADDGAALTRLCGSQAVAHPIVSKGKVVGVLMVGGKRGPDPEVTSFETQLIEATAAYLSVFVENAGLYAEQQAMFLGVLRALSASIDAKDRYTRGHSERVAHLAYALAIEAGIDNEQAERVRISGLLHDVGKIGVPEAVLCKRGKLTDEEFEQIKQHPAIGYGILKDIPGLADVLPGVLHHHEQWCGRGYPDRLAEEGIPLMARILAIADSFDAMSSNRSYRPAMPRETVLEEIRRCAGKQFDAELVPAFLRLDLSEYDRLVAAHQAYEAKAA